MKLGNETTTGDSLAQGLVVPAWSNVPTAVGVDPATIGGSGKITGVTQPDAVGQYTEPDIRDSYDWLYGECDEQREQHHDNGDGVRPVYATVTATVYNNTGTITGGPISLTSGAASPALPLNVGSNLIHLVVTAQDGTTKIYSVTVNRASHDSSGGSITPPTISDEDSMPDIPIEVPSTVPEPEIAFSDITGHWAETSNI